MYSYEGHFAQGATTSGAGRHLFTPTDKLYMSYWVKYSSNYVGSGVGYHPHEWNILTTKDWEYQGPADTYLTMYIEQNAGRPIIAMQDSKNVDPACILLNNNSFVGCNGDFDSYAFSENRSVCSCNGSYIWFELRLLAYKRSKQSPVPVDGRTRLPYQVIIFGNPAGINRVIITFHNNTGT